MTEGTGVQPVQLVNCTGAGEMSKFSCMWNFHAIPDAYLEVAPRD